MRGKPRIVAACAEASRRGIAAGMALAQARALATDLRAEPWDEDRLARVALRVTTALLEASPRVSWSGGRTDGRIVGRNEGVWWVDAAGLGEEKRLTQQLLRIAKKLDFGPVRIGTADSAIAAYAATFTLPSARPPARQTALVRSGRDAAFLARYPVRLLALSDELADTFAALGITTVGQVASLDGDEVESRFGPEGVAAHLLSRGIDLRGPSLPRDDTIPAAACDLGAPVASAEPLLFVIKGALASLGGALRNQGLAAREITVTLGLDDGSSSVRSVRPARPTSHEAALFDHCRALLDDWRLEEPVVSLSLTASETIPAAGEQGDLLARRWTDPTALESAFDRIRGREGGDAVAVPEARDGHLPSDGGVWLDQATHRRVDAATHAAVREPAVRPSAMRLLAIPLPIRVRLGRNGLEAFREGETWTDVAAWSGPERMAPRWWRQAEAARDYFVARAADGALWLLYRARRAWFAEGWFD